MLAKKRRFNYQEKQYSNPFFQRRNRGMRPVKTRSKKPLAILAIFLFLSLVWLIFSSSIFRIKSVEIKGLNKISGSGIEDLFWQQTHKRKLLFGSQSNLFLFSKDEFAKSIKESYNFENLDVNKDLPGKVVLTVKEKENVAIWNEDGKNYLIDRDGYIITEAQQDDFNQKDHPYIENTSDKKISDKRVGVESKKIIFMLDLFNKFKEGKIDYQIAKVGLDSDIDTAKLYLANGPYVSFNTNNDLDKQIEKISALYRDMHKDEFSKKEYFDLRYGDRIYYK